MLKIYKTKFFFKLNNGDWQRCGAEGYVCGEESDVEKKTIIIDSHSFEEAIDGIKNAEHVISGVHTDKTIFLRRPYIEISGLYYGNGMGRKTLHKKDVQSFAYMVTSEEMKYVTVDWIMKHLSVEDAIQYFKDRGMTICPIQM